MSKRARKTAMRMRCWMKRNGNVRFECFCVRSSALRLPLSRLRRARVAFARALVDSHFTLEGFCGWEKAIGGSLSELERRFCLSLRTNRPFEHLDFARIACRVVVVISIVIASFYHHHRFTHLSSPQPFLLLSQTRRLSPSRDVLSKKSVSTPS